MHLQYLALPLCSAFAAFLGEESSAGGVLEDFSDAFIGLGAAFEVVAGAYLLLDFVALIEMVSIQLRFNRIASNHARKVIGGVKREAAGRGSRWE